MSQITPEFIEKCRERRAIYDSIRPLYKWNKSETMHVFHFMLNVKDQDWEACKEMVDNGEIEL